MLDAEYSVVRPVDRFLAHLSAVDRSPQTVRSYAFDLRVLLVFLLQSGLSWGAEMLEDLGQFVAWLGRSPAVGQLHHNHMRRPPSCLAK